MLFIPVEDNSVEMVRPIGLLTPFHALLLALCPQGRQMLVWFTSLRAVVVACDVLHAQSVLRGLAAIRAATGSAPRVTLGLPSDILSRFEGDARLVKAVADAQEALGVWKAKHSEVRAGVLEHGSCP